MAISTREKILTVFNIMNVIMGSGVLGMPYAMNSLGYALFTVLLILFYFLGIFAIQNLVDCCELTNIDSYESMGQKSYGKLGRYYVTFCIFLQSFSAMVSFMYIVKSELPEVLATLGNRLFGACPAAEPLYVNGTFLYLIVLFLIVMPLAALKRIDFLAFTSALAMIAMGVFTVIVTVFSFIIECPAVEKEHGLSGFSAENATVKIPCKGFENFTAENNEKDWKRFEAGVAALNNITNNGAESCPILPGPTQLTKAILAVPIMVFAFMCQESIVSVYSQVRKVNGTGKEMMLISKVALSSVLVLYWFIAFMSYKTWRTATISDMLLPYSYGHSDSLWVVLARCCSIVCVILSAPLLHYPCRRSLTILIFGNDDFRWDRHLGIMVILLGLVAVLVAVASDLKQIFAYGGIISSGSLMIILPNICYHKLTRAENLEKIQNCGDTDENDKFIITADASMFEISQVRRTFSLVVGILGIAFMGMCFALQIMTDVGYFADL